MIFMEKISRCSQGLRDIRHGGIEVTSVLFAGDLLTPSRVDHCHALKCFAAECEAAGMKTITSKSDLIVPSQKKAPFRGRERPYLPVDLIHSTHE